MTRKRVVNILLEPRELKALDDATRKGQSRSALVRQIVDDYLEGQARRKAAASVGVRP